MTGLCYLSDRPVVEVVGRACGGITLTQPQPCVTGHFPCQPSLSTVSKVAGFFVARDTELEWKRGLEMSVAVSMIQCFVFVLFFLFFHQ